MDSVISRLALCRPVKVALCVAALAAAPMACASTPTDTQPQAAEPASEPILLAQARTTGRKAPSQPGVEFESAKSSIALLARELSEKTGRSLVVMNGLEMTEVGPYEKKKRAAAEWVDLIATDAKLRVVRGATYDFLFPAGYEAVASAPVGPNLEQSLGSRRTTLHVEFGTPLFAALALLSHSLQSAIVADNIVSDARCGETHLLNVTVSEALDALLMSARIPGRSIVLRSEPHSTFIYSAGRPLRQALHFDPAGHARPEWLDRQVTLYLPVAPSEPGHLQGYGRAIPLSACLPELARQTGLRFEADARTSSLPINPAVIPNVRVETALDLIINQWPLPHFGYRTEGDTVRFVYLGPPVE